MTSKQTSSIQWICLTVQLICLAVQWIIHQSNLQKRRIDFQISSHSKLWLELNHQSCTSEDEMLSLFIIIYIARIMTIYSSLKHMRCYHLYLSSCLALLVINRKSYQLILRFIINHALSSLMWWINSMRSFWSCFSISSWSRMSKLCKNVFFIFLMWNEICKSELSYSNKVAKYLSAKEIIFCKILKLLLL